MNKILSNLYTFLCILNLFILMFISGVMINSTYIICENGYARDFLNTVSAVPNYIWYSVPSAVVSYLAMLAIIYSTRVHPKRQHTTLHIIADAAKILLAVIVFLELDMSYSGVLLLVIIDMISEVRNRKRQAAFFAISMILYMFANYNIISLYIHMVPFSKYLIYYPESLQNLILGICSVLSSLNLIIFILYILILMHSQQRETKRISVLNEQLNSANNQLKQMNSRLQKYAENAERVSKIKERNRLAREIHDTIGHALTGIIAGIDACITMVDYSPKDTKKQLSVISNVARQGLKDVRNSVSKLQPDSLENLPLEDALKKMLNDIGKAAKTDINFINNAGILKFDHDEEEAVYRVVQEGVTNAIRHGKASKISITIDKKNKWLRISVCDNGAGCKHIKKGFGIQHIEERINLLGGVVSYDGTNGFKIFAGIPIRWGKKYD